MDYTVLKDVLLAVIAVVISAVGYAVTFFAKAYKVDGEKWDEKKFQRTFIIAILTGIAVGIAASMQKVPMEQAETWLTVVSQGYWVILIDKAASYIQDWWAKRNAPPAPEKPDKDVEDVVNELSKNDNGTPK